MTFGQVPNLSFVLFLFAPVLSVFGLGRIFLLVLVWACCFLFAPSISLAALSLAVVLADSRNLPTPCTLHLPHFACPARESL